MASIQVTFVIFPSTEADRRKFIAICFTQVYTISKATIERKIATKIIRVSRSYTTYSGKKKCQWTWHLRITMLYALWLHFHSNQLPLFLMLTFFSLNLHTSDVLAFIKFGCGHYKRNLTKGQLIHQFPVSFFHVNGFTFNF